MQSAAGEGRGCVLRVKQSAAGRGEGLHAEGLAALLDPAP